MFRLIYLDRPGDVDDAETIAAAEELAGGLLWQLPDDPFVYVTDDGSVHAEYIPMGRAA